MEDGDADVVGILVLTLVIGDVDLTGPLTHVLHFGVSRVGVRDDAVV